MLPKGNLSLTLSHSSSFSLSPLSSSVSRCWASCNQRGTHCSGDNIFRVNQAQEETVLRWHLTITLAQQKCINSRNVHVSQSREFIFFCNGDQNIAQELGPPTELLTQGGVSGRLCPATRLCLFCLGDKLALLSHLIFQIFDYLSLSHLMGFMTLYDYGLQRG